MIENWKISPQTSEGFVKAMKDAYDNDLLNFRINPDICQVVENSTNASALEDIKYINDHYPEMWHWVDRFRSSETVGNPMVHYFEKIGNFSPSTIRYIKHVGDIFKYFNSLVNCRIIAEIGAGYGGLCKIMHDIYTPSRYLLFDMEPCLEVQRKFLMRFGIMHTLVRNLNIPVAQDSIDLVIASCSWSELDKDTKLLYFNNVISKAKQGYFILNYDPDENIEFLKSNLPNKEFVRDRDNPFIFIFR